MPSTLAVPAGNRPSGTSAVHHAFDHFVDGAVAASRHDQVGAAGDVFARDGSGGPRTRVGAATIW